jgi:hypothetical protein
LKKPILKRWAFLFVKRSVKPFKELKQEQNHYVKHGYKTEIQIIPREITGIWKEDVKTEINAISSKDSKVEPFEKTVYSKEMKHNGKCNKADPR